MAYQIAACELSEPGYFHREYANDIPDQADQNSWLGLGKRAAVVALPFFSLYQPLNFSLALSMGSLRAATSFAQLYSNFGNGAGQISIDLAQSGIAIIALAGTIFAHPIGMLITTGQDSTTELLHLIRHLNGGEYQKVLEDCLNLANNALYLALFLDGGLGFAVASLAMQVLVGLYHSVDEFRKGHTLEGAGRLAMTLVRCNQLSDQVNTWRLKSRLEELCAKGWKSDLSDRERDMRADALAEFKKTRSSVSSGYIEFANDEHTLAHIGYHDTGYKVITILGDDSGFFTDGAQYILPMFRTNWQIKYPQLDWDYAFVAGRPYVKHTYPSFDIYTADHSLLQFVVAR